MRQILDSTHRLLPPETIVYAKANNSYVTGKIVGVADINYLGIQYIILTEPADKKQYSALVIHEDFLISKEKYPF